MKKDYTVNICFLISVILHTVFFTAILIKDTTSLLPTKKHPAHIDKKSNRNVIEILSYEASPEELYKADMLSLSEAQAAQTKQETISPYMQSAWDNTFDDLRIKKAIPTQFTDTNKLHMDTESRIHVLNQKIKPNTNILDFKSHIQFPPNQKRIWISNPLLQYKNKYLHELKAGKAKGVFLINSKGIIKNIMINNTNNTANREKLIRVIQKGYITSSKNIKPQWINFEII